MMPSFCVLIPVFSFVIPLKPREPRWFELGNVLRPRTIWSGCHVGPFKIVRIEFSAQESVLEAERWLVSIMSVAAGMLLAGAIVSPTQITAA
jgi:hypothetical protein